MNTSRFASIVLLICSLALLAADDAGKKDLAQLQGEWSMISGRQSGFDLPEAYLKTGKRVFKDDQVTVTIGGELLMKATCTLDATKDPRTIDYAITDGPNKGKKQLGIYKFDGEIVHFCYAGPDQPRPDSFESKSGDGRTVSAWKKAQAASK